MMRFRDRDLAMQWLREAGPDDADDLPSASAPDEPPPARRDVDRLVDQALDPAMPVAPVTYAAIEQLVQELLDAGLPEPEVLGVARRMAAVITASSAR
jgi:hypothetical protein